MSRPIFLQIVLTFQVEDARCAMKIYQLHKKQWEKSLKDKGYKTIIDSAPTIFMGKNNKDIKKRYRDRRDARERRREKRKEKGKIS